MIAPVASNIGRTRKETAFHILRNATSETNIECNAFSHTRVESRNYWKCFLTYFLVLLLDSLWQNSC